MGEDISKFITCLVVIFDVHILFIKFLLVLPLVLLTLMIGMEIKATLDSEKMGLRSGTMNTFLPTSNSLGCIGTTKKSFM